MRRTIYETTNVVDQAAIQVVVVSRHVWTCLNMSKRIHCTSSLSTLERAAAHRSSCACCCCWVYTNGCRMSQWLMYALHVMFMTSSTCIFSRRFEMCFGRWSYLDDIYCDVRCFQAKYLFSKQIGRCRVEIRLWVSAKVFFHFKSIQEIFFSKKKSA